jgi:hypothetical protein
MAELTEFDKQCLENIPPQVMRIICKQVEERITKIFGGSVNLPYTYCSKCSESLTFSKMFKTRCVCDVTTFESLCANHFAEKLESELCQKYLDEHKPKLDLNDFARV